MQKLKNKDVAAMVAGLVVTYLYTRYVNKTAEKRMESKFDHKLDLIAIGRARDICVARVNDGYYRSYIHASNDLNQEIKLQMLAIRQDI